MGLYMEIPIICIPEALTAKQHQRLSELHEMLPQIVSSITPIDDGYTLHLHEDVAIMLLVEYVQLEHLCCPFLSFSLRVNAGEKSIKLDISGGDGVKEFVYQTLIHELE